MGKQNVSLGNHIEVLPNGKCTLVDEDNIILVADVDNLTASDVNTPELIEYQLSMGKAFTGAIEFFGGLPYVFVSINE